MPLVLVTSDDAALPRAVQSVLPEGQLHVLAGAMQELPADVQWCFVDWLLDDVSGLELCRRIRGAARTTNCHITMVLVSDDPVARARALAAGADDYMIGPLTAQSLAERLRFYTHLPDATPAKPLTSPVGLTLDSAAFQVRWNGQLIPLRPREFRLLELFLTHPDRLLSRERIIALLDDGSEVGDERTVDVWVGRLRRTLERHGVDNLLRTVRSMGYVFDTPVLPSGQR